MNACGFYVCVFFSLLSNRWKTNSLNLLKTFTVNAFYSPANVIAFDKCNSVFCSCTAICNPDHQLWLRLCQTECHLFRSMHFGFTGRIPLIPLNSKSNCSPNNRKCIPHNFYHSIISNSSVGLSIFFPVGLSNFRLVDIRQRKIPRK